MDFEIKITVSDDFTKSYTAHQHVCKQMRKALEDRLNDWFRGPLTKMAECAARHWWNDESVPNLAARFKVEERQISRWLRSMEDLLRLHGWKLPPPPPSPSEVEWTKSVLGKDAEWLRKVYAEESPGLTTGSPIPEKVS